MSAVDLELLADLLSRTESGEFRWRSVPMGPLTRLSVNADPYKFILTGSSEEGRLPTVLSVLNLRAETVQRKISETSMCGDLLRSLFQAAAVSAGEGASGLPLGLFQLDPDGCVISYECDERTVSGIDSGMVVGRNFFTDILVNRLPDIACSFNQMVSGRAARLVETFHEVVRQPTGMQSVLIVMSQNRRTKGVRLLVLENRES